MTLQKGDIEHLASLARIAVSDEEKSALAEKIDAVLGYVGEISNVDTSMYEHAEAGAHRNVMRTDTALSAAGDERELVLKNAPQKEGDFIKVQQMFS